MLTKEQIAQRKNGIYASEVSAIVGLNPYKTAGEVWAEKTGMIPHDDELDHNEDIERGNFLERAIIEWMAHRTGEVIQPNSTSYAHPDIEWAHATPDGIVVKSGEYLKAVAEVKAPSWRTAKDWADPDVIPDGVPEMYLAQVQWQMGCTGAPRALVGALIDSRLQVYDIAYSPVLFDVLHAKVERFWDRVKRGTPPPVQSPNDGKWLSQVYYREKGKDLYTLTGEDEEHFKGIAKSYIEAGDEVKRATEKKDYCKAQLQERIGDLTGIQGKGWYVYWKTPRSKKATIDWEAIAREAGASEELIQRHSKPATLGRRINVKVKE